MNISTYNVGRASLNKFKLKIDAMLKTKPDILFIQDIRLNNKENIFSKEVRFNIAGSYLSYCNSSKGERSVAILIKQTLNHEIIKSFCSVDENILILDLKINEFRLSLVSCYGPTVSKNRFFYKQLREKISSIGNTDFIIAGDLNAIPTTLQPEQGIEHLDLINTNALPNFEHCKELSLWIEESFCVDLFRLINPTKLDFSYVPFSKTKTNRSRIDQVLVSPHLANIFSSCYYEPLKASLFDHKAIMFNTLKNNSKRECTINSSLLDIDGLSDHVRVAVYELLIEHCEIEDRQHLQNIISQISLAFKLKNDLSLTEFKNDKLILLWIEKKDRT
ncbi:MAG: endonuclease/exonuclease/phosphatase family protein, partial [Mesoflavibacter sp.]|nr:endonuclease/exonuclease/phosphatase family protein [Mesoflavibacter sp.]